MAIANSKLPSGISIHALTRSATGVARNTQTYITYFNPRTHEECDHSYAASNGSGMLFQSTHSRGVRHDIIRTIRKRARISIHALTRSATFDCPSIVTFSRFQSTHSRGVRLPFYLDEDVVNVFQSTHSRGVRRRIIAIINEFMYKSTD